MSFLGGGAECSTAGNPLSQMKSHMQDDKSLQRDRMGARGPASAAGGFRTANPVAPQDEVSFGELSKRRWGGMNLSFTC